MSSTPSDASPLFALADGNNFYVSCERVFEPKVRDVPVVVLSNNDGCIFSRSNEAKKLGIPMGAPFYRWRPLIVSKGVRVFSSNYPLYGEMSLRMMDTLFSLTPHMEVYSIDEAFLDVPVGPAEAEGWAEGVRRRVLRDVGIPLSLGVASTKTLCKVAGRSAKRDSRGVRILIGQEEIRSALEATGVEELWGIGRQLSKFLIGQGILNGEKLRECDDRWVRAHLGLAGLRTVMELRGIPCVQGEEAPMEGRSVSTSRSFADPLPDPSALREAVACFVATAASKLRENGAMASGLHLFLTTSPFRGDYRSQTAFCSLARPSSYTPTLIGAAWRLLESLNPENLSQVKKAGIILTDLVEESKTPPRLFGMNAALERERGLMEAVDRIQKRWGGQAIQTAAEGRSREWLTRQSRRSPRYTTDWNELPLVKAKG